jgi:hypothetical protein
MPEEKPTRAGAGQDPPGTHTRGILSGAYGTGGATRLGPPKAFSGR